MSVEVAGNRSSNRWQRGVWPDVNDSFSVNIDQHRTSESNGATTIKSTGASTRSMPSNSSFPAAVTEHEISGLRSRHSSSNQWGCSKNTVANFFLEHEEDQSLAMSDGGARLPLADGRRNDTDDGHIMIPLTNLSLTSTEVVAVGVETTVTTRRSREGRTRFFQRAMSCDVDNRPFILAAGCRGGSPVVLGETKYDRRYQQGITVEGVDAMSVEDILSPNSKRTSNPFNVTAEEGQSDGVVQDNLKSTDKDSGIVCSDEDLRSILSEVTLTRRMSAEAKRERMKSNRSLSLDSSSFLKLHIKRLQADSPYWLSRILSQRERRDSGSGNGAPANTSCGNAATTTPPANDASGTVPLGDESHSDTLRRRAILTETEPAAGSPPDDGDRLSDPAQSRRASTVSGCSDDECSLLLQVDAGSGSSGRKHGNINPCGVESKSPPPILPPTHPVSKVVWNEGSVVDAELFGHAIEIYLTSGGTATSAGMTSGDAIVASDVSRVVTPMLSTLKGLFVK